MAGEDYTSPINGKTYRVPKYEEPADAPVAFKDFADNLPPGGIDFDPDRVGQVVQSLDGAAWDKGMALQVVDAVPDDSDGEVGDVVFIPGGPGGLPAVGGGKVLQVVREAEGTNKTVNTTAQEKILSASITPLNADSNIIIYCTFRAGVTSSANCRFQAYLVNPTPDLGIPGAEVGRFGHVGSNEFYTSATMIGYDTPGSTATKTYELRVSAMDAGTTINIDNASQTAQIIIMELAA